MYHFVYFIFYLLSLLPFRILHLVSDAIYEVAYHIIRYRRNVVMHNLAIAFPEKLQTERKKIAKQFYRNLIDTFLEGAKVLYISRKSLHKRFSANYDLINELFASGKNVQIHSGHFFNWEFANYAFADKLHYPFLGVYMPIRNKVLNKLFIKLRSRFGTKLIDATNFKKEFHALKDQQYCLGLVGDQNPGDPAKAFWTDFFGRRTPFIKGLELGAKANNTAVVFCHFYPIKRGYYKADLKLLTIESSAMPDGEITLEFVRLMEESIRKNPSNYLWSHRRWKHQWKDAYKNLLIGKDGVPGAKIEFQ